MSEHTPHSTANMLEITPVTLRRWCAAHAEFLSSGANPPERGEARRFTGKDIEVLKHIKSLRAQGKTEAKINEQLRTLTFAEIETEANSEALTLEYPTETTDDPETTILAIQVLDAINTQNRKIEALEKLAETNKQSQRDYIQGLAVGFIGAAVFFLILLLLISIYHR